MKKKIAEAVIVGLVIVLLMSTFCRALDSNWERGFAAALRNRDAAYEGVKLVYDRYGYLTTTCVENLQQTVFKDRAFQLDKILKEHFNTTISK